MKHVKLITMNINKYGHYLHGLKLDKITLCVPSAGHTLFTTTTLIKLNRVLHI